MYLWGKFFLLLIPLQSFFSTFWPTCWGLFLGFFALGNALTFANNLLEMFCSSFPSALSSAHLANFLVLIPWIFLPFPSTWTIFFSWPFLLLLLLADPILKMIFLPPAPPLKKCQAKTHRRNSTSSSTATINKQREQQKSMSKRPAQTPEKSGVPPKRRVIELDDLFEPTEQRSQQLQPATTPNRTGSGGGNQQPANGAAAAANSQQAMALATQQRPQQTLSGGGGGDLQAMAMMNQQLQQPPLGGGGGNLAGGVQIGRVRSLAEIEQLNLLKREIEERKKATEKAKQPPGLELLDEFGPNHLTTSDFFWCGWTSKHLFPRLRLKLAMVYASLIELERVGETPVTNVQLTNGDLVVCVYGWEKQAQFLNSALTGQEGKIIEMRSLVPKENKAARSMLPFRLLFTADSHLQIEDNPADMTVAINNPNVASTSAAAASSSGFELDPNPCSSSSLYTTPPPSAPPSSPPEMPSSSRDLHFARELHSIINRRLPPPAAAKATAKMVHPSGETQQQQQSKKGGPTEVIDLGDEDEEEMEMEEFTEGEEEEEIPPELQTQEFMQKELKAPPLSEYKIRRLTRNAWVHEDELEEEEKDRADHCSICQDAEPDRMAVQLPCGHRFHRHCGLKWLRECGSCPLCRKVPK